MYSGVVEKIKTTNIENAGGFHIFVNADKILHQGRGFVETMLLEVSAILPGYHHFCMGAFTPEWVPSMPQIPLAGTQLVMQVEKVNGSTLNDHIHMATKWGAYKAYMEVVTKMSKADLYRLDMYSGSHWRPGVRFRDPRILALYFIENPLVFGMLSSYGFLRLSKLTDSRWVIQENSDLLQNTFDKRLELVENFKSEFGLVEKAQT